LTARAVTLLLLALIAWVQAELWAGRWGMRNVMDKRAELAGLQQANAQAQARNDRLQAEVSDLKEGLEMVEEKARSELGMVRPDELMVVLAPSGPAPAASGPGAAPAGAAGASVAPGADVPAASTAR
jgi:cell division protein FtsB